METIMQPNAAGPGPVVQADGAPEKTPAPVKEETAGVHPQMEAEKKINSSVMSIRLTPDGLVIRDDQVGGDDVAELSGVYCEGVQYYDLRGIEYINNTGMAILIDLLKSLLEMGVEVQFVNVHENIRRKIREMGLDKIINCG